MPFTVRGRLDAPREVSYRLDLAGGPLPERVAVATFERALSAWARSGVVDFRPAGAGDEPVLVATWHRGAPFGRDTSVAHTAPAGDGQIVRFDADAAWSVDGGPGESFLRTAAHEIGHVLGLGHATDPDALMYAVPTAVLPRPPDLAGLHSLYGGGEDGPGDLLVERDGVRLLLRRVAPPDLTAFAARGDDEVLVWRTDPEGLRALTVYRLDARGRLASTDGPRLGAAPAEPPAGSGLRVSRP